MNWNTTKIEKEVMEGNTVTLQFEYLGDKSVKKVDPHCSCTSYNWDDNVLSLMVETDLVSHILPKKVYETTKQYVKYTYADVLFEDGEKDKVEVYLTVKEIPGRNDK